MRASLIVSIGWFCLMHDIGGKQTEPEKWEMPNMTMYWMIEKSVCNVYGRKYRGTIVE